MMTAAFAIGFLIGAISVFLALTKDDDDDMDSYA